MSTEETKEINNIYSLKDEEGNSIIISSPIIPGTYRWLADE